MLSEERKSQILSSLKEDHIPISDVFFETCADIKADMYYTGELSIDDKKRVHELMSAYVKVMETEPEKTIPLIEQLYELRDKYDRTRKSMGL